MGGKSGTLVRPRRPVRVMIEISIAENSPMALIPLQPTFGGSVLACFAPPATLELTVLKKSSARSSFGLLSACRGMAILCAHGAGRSSQLMQKEG